jgi:hypothetical protein
VTVWLNSVASARISGGPLSAGARGEIAGADRGRGPFERGEWLGQCAGEAEADQGRGGEDDTADRCEQQPVAPYARVERGGRIGDPHRPSDHSAGSNRDGDVDQVGA